MTYNQQPQVGFVMPQPGQQQPYYPPAPPGSNQHQPNTHYPPPYQPQHQPFPQPIQSQPSHAPPVTNNWITPDFQTYLFGATSFRVKQKVEMLEALVDWETANKYSVKDQHGNKVFYAAEMNDCFRLQFCDKWRPFTMRLKDKSGRDILTFERPLRCAQTCCCLCCPQEIRVSTPGGVFLGSVVENFAFCSQKFSIKNAAGQTVLKITGPWVPCAFKCQAVSFSLRALDGSRVGHISKEFGGVIREMFTDADTFSISFPQDLSPEIKAVALSALFLIDFMFFEEK